MRQERPAEVLQWQIGVKIWGEAKTSTHACESAPPAVVIVASQSGLEPCSAPFEAPTQILYLGFYR
jgi:hypothetical protein